MSRQYKFNLPYIIDVMHVEFGIGQLKSEGIFQRLPVALQQRVEAAAASWQSVAITKEDCDSIDDETWSLLEAKLV